MDDAIGLGNLTHKDQQAAFSVINQLGECQTREELNQVLKSAIIPLMDCSGAFYGRLKKEQNNLQLIDEIYESSLTRHSWNSFVEIAKQTQLLESALFGETHNRLATDFFCCIGQDFHQANRCCAVVAIYDALKPNLVLYFCRLKPQDHYYTIREFNLLQILRSTLLQSIKAVLYLEKCQNLQLVMDHLPDDHEPLALVNNKGDMMYKNQAFKEIINHENFRNLSFLLAKKGNQISVSQGDRNMIKVGRRLYEVTLKPVDNGADAVGPMYLLCLSRAYNKKDHLFKQWRQAGLTNRELQIAMLLYQGVSTRNISETLFLSYHTVRNHISHIYDKTGVSSRGELLTWED